MHPTALHWTSTFGDSIWRMRGSSPPSWTIVSLFSPAPPYRGQDELKGIDADADTHHLRPGCRALHSPHAGPRHRETGGGRGSARACRGRPRGRPARGKLRTIVSFDARETGPERARGT